MTNSRTDAALWTGPRKAMLVVLLAVQLAVAYLIGTQHLLVNASGGFFAPIALTVIAPVLAFLAAFMLIRGFRGFVLAQNPRTLTMIQVWRVVGFGFLLLYAADHLPGVFAIPAGVGDLIVGLVALAVVLRLEQDPSYATTVAFMQFHWFGLADFVVAVAAAGLTAGFLPSLAPGGVTSAPMDVWPLNLFPAFLVPTFIIAQLAAIFVAVHRRRGFGRSDAALSPA